MFLNTLILIFFKKKICLFYTVIFSLYLVCFLSHSLLLWHLILKYIKSHGFSFCLFISLSHNTNIIFFLLTGTFLLSLLPLFYLFFLNSLFLFHTVFFLSLSTTQPDGFILPNLALLSLSKILYWQSTQLFQSFCCPIMSVFVSEATSLYEEGSKQT